VCYDLVPDHRIEDGCQVFAFLVPPCGGLKQDWRFVIGLLVKEDWCFIVGLHVPVQHEQHEEDLLLLDLFFIAYLLLLGLFCVTDLLVMVRPEHCDVNVS
jgi:hypothetical protein